MTNSTAIPYISNRLLEVRSKHIRPIIKIEGKKHFMGNYTIKEIKEADFRSNLSTHIQEEVDFSNLEKVCEIFTFHHHSKGTRNFKPTLMEIYSQIPKEKADGIVAFECYLEEVISETLQKGKIILYRNK